MSLQFNVATLLGEPLGATRVYEIDERALVDTEEPRHERVAGRAVFLRTKEGVFVSATLHGVQREACSRCLRDVETPVDLEIREEYFARVDVHTGASLPPPEDPEAFRVDARHTLDLEDAVRQYWTAALSMQPLCRPDCKGICPRCGRDLNAGSCECGPEEDSRWSALRELAGKREGS
jgi:uncharacterized protein